MLENELLPETFVRKEAQNKKSMVNKRTLSVLLVLAILQLSLANYCNIATCERKRYQTVCRYPSGKPASRCYRGGHLGAGLKQREKHAILALHNRLRRKLANGQEKRGSHGPQYPAKHMPDLEWDKELEYVAQRWANQCMYGHDKCRDVERFEVGQNVAYEGTTGNISTINILDMVQRWYDEVKYYNRNDIFHFKSTHTSNGKDIGHYTQMVWATTTKIGCGLKNYWNEGFKNKFLVCNYGPAGNILTLPVYQRRS